MQNRPPGPRQPPGGLIQEMKPPERKPSGVLIFTASRIFLDALIAIRQVTKSSLTTEEKEMGITRHRDAVNGGMAEMV